MYCPGPDLSHLFPCIAFNAGPPLDGITNGHGDRNVPSQQVSNAVDRNGDRNQFSPGQDVYDLSSMAPGFEIDDSTVFWYAWTSDVCEGWARSDATSKKIGDSVGYDVEGYYKLVRKDENQDRRELGRGPLRLALAWDVSESMTGTTPATAYQVQVVGPIGIDPWTGASHPEDPQLRSGSAGRSSPSNPTN